MLIVLEAAAADITGPVLVGVVTLAVLMAGLGFVRQVGKGRPHSR